MADPAHLVEELLARNPGTIRRGRILEARESGSASGLLPTGCEEVDVLLGGGLPRGRLVEFMGHGSASVGVTSLAHRLLRGVTRDSGLAAWVDLANAFDPTSAEAAGVVLGRLLWVRPPDLIAAFAATEILLATGGFTLVVLDTTGIQAGNSLQNRRKGFSPPHQATHEWPGGNREKRRGQRMLAAPQTWIRLARTAERYGSTLLVLPGEIVSSERRGLAGTAAGVRIELSRARPLWEGTPQGPSLLEGLSLRVDVTRNRESDRMGIRSCRTHIGLP